MSRKTKGSVYVVGADPKASLLEEVASGRASPNVERRAFSIVGWRGWPPLLRHDHVLAATNCMHLIFHHPSNHSSESPCLQCEGLQLRLHV